MKNAMKGLAFLIVVAAMWSAYSAHRPSPSTPDITTTPVPAPATADPQPSDPLVPVQAPPSSASPLPVPAEAPPSVLTAPEPAKAPLADQGDDPPDVIAERLNSSHASSTAPVRSTFVGDLMMKADREGDRNGCKGGELLLNGGGIHFTCPADDKKSVALTVAEIKKVHKSGVEAADGHKYHFDIQDHKANESEKLFQTWLDQVRASQ